MVPWVGSEMASEEFQVAWEAAADILRWAGAAAIQALQSVVSAVRWQDLFQPDAVLPTIAEIIRIKEFVAWILDELIQAEAGFVLNRFDIPLRIGLAIASLARRGTGEGGNSASPLAI